MIRLLVASLSTPEAVADFGCGPRDRFGHEQDRAVVDPFASDLPLLGNAQRVLLDDPGCRRHDQQGELAAPGSFQRAQARLQAGPAALRSRWR